MEKRKITLFQHENGNRDPMITLEVTSHPAYLKNKLTIADVDKACELVRSWLTKKMEGK